MPYGSLILAGVIAGAAAGAEPNATPSAPGPAHRAGVAHFRGGDLQAATVDLERHLVSDPGNARVLALLGSCYDRLGQPVRARRCWRQVADAAPSPRLALLAQLRLEPSARTAGPAAADRAVDPALGRFEPDVAHVHTDHFLIEAHNRALAALVAGRAESHLETIRATILGEALYPHRVRIRIHRDLVAYGADFGAPHWSGGGFRIEPRPDGTMAREIHLVQRTADGMFNDRLVDVQLPHELSHLVVAEFFGQRRCPVWLDEALAMMAEGGPPDRKRAETRRFLARFNAHVPLHELIDRPDWPPDYPQEVLYAQAESVGRFLWARLGEQRGQYFLAQLRTGSRASDTLLRILGRSSDATATGSRRSDVLEDLEDDWLRSLDNDPPGR